MKIVNIFFLLLFPTIIGLAQSTVQPNLYAIKKEFYKQIEKSERKNKIKTNEHDGDNLTQQFKRWEEFMLPRVYPSGNFPNPTATWNAMNNSIHKSKSAGFSTEQWSSLGPNKAPADFGIGRVNCITFDPTNNNIVWLGTPDGGLWKSMNGGNTWTSNTDWLPNIGVADIAIDSLNPLNMYIATGDRYGYAVGSNRFWGGTYSLGVLHSIDGGITWTTTGLNYSVINSKLITRLIINPTNPLILLAACSDGIWRTTNGGTTWSQVANMITYDLEFQPGNPQIIYAGANEVYQSTNGGQSFSKISTGVNSTSNRLSIAISPNNSNIIYTLNTASEIYKSSNGGSTWSYVSKCPTTLYGYYDCVLEVSPTDVNTIVVAGFDMNISSNGGTSWNQIGTNIHPDFHEVKFLPNSNTTFFAGNDGGIFFSNDAGNTFANKDSSLAITQFYRMATTRQNVNHVLAGAQDNNVMEFKNGAWFLVPGGDGMETLIDPLDSNIYYFEFQKW